MTLEEADAIAEKARAIVAEQGRDQENGRRRYEDERIVVETEPDTDFVLIHVKTPTDEGFELQQVLRYSYERESEFGEERGFSNDVHSWSGSWIEHIQSLASGDSGPVSA